MEEGEKEEAEKAEGEKKDDETKSDEEKKPKTKTVWDWEKINTIKPIWMRKPAEVEESEYEEFYKSITKDYEAPLAHVHFIAEGKLCCSRLNLHFCRI